VTRFTQWVARKNEQAKAEKHRLGPVTVTLPNGTVQVLPYRPRNGR
jgi:hypothetical protein